MTTLINLLSKTDLWALPAGRHEDGLGLSLLVGKDLKSRSWTLRVEGSFRGIGGLRKVTVEQARQRRDALLVAAAQSPDEPAPAAPVLRAVPTFLERAKEVIPVQIQGARTRHTKYSWDRSLLHFAKDLHDKKVTDVTSADVVAVLAPIWLTKAPTAANVQKHIAKVFSTCIADRIIDRNPAALQDNLEHKLKSKKRRIKHHPAMPYAEVPAYVASLLAKDDMSALALAFTILTGVRSAEAYTARWDDIDGDNIWSVRSGDEMKNGLFARVPLTAKAIAVLAAVKVLAARNHLRGAPDTFIFPGLTEGHISHHTMLYRLKTTHPRLTVHGFRSSFRTWGQEVTSIEHDTLEYCLHHIEGSRTEQAYMRGECLDKRRDALEQWAAYCLPVTTPHLAVAA